MTLEKAFKAEPALPELYNSDEDVKELIDKCRILKVVLEMPVNMLVA